MDKLAKRRIDLALSGGGTRAALYSAGALLAVVEAAADDEVEIGTISAVSGSALLMADLILASDDVGADAPAEERVAVVRSEIDTIARRGFCMSVWGMAMIWLLLVLLLNTVGVALAGTDKSVGWVGRSALVVFSVVLALGAILTARRTFPFRLRRPKLSLRSLGPARERKWFPGDRERSGCLVPAERTVFVTTCLATSEPVALDPWTPYEVSGEVVRPASLADLAKASSAVPFYSSAIVLDERVLVDGGVVDNLGVSTFCDPTFLGSVGRSGDLGQPGDPGNEVVIVDASPALPAPVLVRTRQQPWREAVDSARPILLLSIMVAMLWIPGVGAYIKGHPLLAGFFVGASLVLPAHYWFAITVRWAIASYRTLRTEACVSQAVMQRNRETGLLHVRLAGRTWECLKLRSAGEFKDVAAREEHDLRTRLSRVRGETAVELVRASYNQMNLHLKRRPSEASLLWLNRLEGDLRSTSVGRWLRSARTPMGRLARVLLLGRKYDQGWRRVVPADFDSDIRPSDRSSTNRQAEV